MKEVRIYQLHIATIFINLLTTLYGRYFGPKTLKQRLKGGFFSRVAVTVSALSGVMLLAAGVILLLIMGASMDELNPLLDYLWYLGAVGIVGLVLVVGSMSRYALFFILTQLWEDGLKSQIGLITGLFPI